MRLTLYQITIPTLTVRYTQLETAIKLVYASIFTESALAYFDAVKYKIEEEKMAVVIQEVSGAQDYNSKFYPSISGVWHNHTIIILFRI
jgi:phosphoenolpyruvate synthase/pyruvate phosphate dikinase